MAPVHGEHHGSAGEGQRKEHRRGRGDHGGVVQPVNHHPVASPQRRGPSSLRKDAPHNHKPQSETQPPSCPIFSTGPLPPATHLHTLSLCSPLLHPVHPLSPPPAPAGGLHCLLCVRCPGSGTQLQQSRFVPGQPDVESQMHTEISNRDHRRPSHAGPLGSITGSIWVIMRASGPRTCLVSATPCSVDMSVGPGSTTQGCWKGCFQRSFKPAPPRSSPEGRCAWRPRSGTAGVSGCLLPFLLGKVPPWPWAGRSWGSLGRRLRKGGALVLRLGCVSRLAGLGPAVSLSPHPQRQEAQPPSLGPLCPVLRAFWGQREGPWRAPSKELEDEGPCPGTTQYCPQGHTDTHASVHAPGGQGLDTGAPSSPHSGASPPAPRSRSLTLLGPSTARLFPCWEWRRESGAVRPGLAGVVVG